MQIRNSVFETNSSSSHSLTITAKDVSPSPFDKEIVQAGVCKVKLGEYGWQWERFYSLPNKLSYLFTQLFSVIPDGDPQEVTQKMRSENCAFDEICSVVEAYTGVRVELVPNSSGYVDHESEGCGLGCTSKELHQLLFSPDSFIQLGNDNDSAPMDMPTDRPQGTVHTFEKWYREPNNTDVPVMLFAEAGRLLTAKGVCLFDYEDDSPLWEKLKDQAVVSSVDVQTEAPWPDHESPDELRGAVANWLSSLDLKFSKSLAVGSQYKLGPHYKVMKECLVLVPQELADELQTLANP